MIKNILVVTCALAALSTHDAITAAASHNGPNKKQHFTIPRSPYTNKKSKEFFELNRRRHVLDKHASTPSAAALAHYQQKKWAKTHINQSNNWQRLPRMYSREEFPALDEIEFITPPHTPRAPLQHLVEVPCMNNEDSSSSTDLSTDTETEESDNDMELIIPYPDHNPSPRPSEVLPLNIAYLIRLSKATAPSKKPRKKLLATRKFRPAPFWKSTIRMYHQQIISNKNERHR